MWKTVKLGEVFKFTNGRSFKKVEWQEVGLPIIRIQNLNNFDAPFNHFNEKYHESIEVNNGDLLFSWSGTIGSSFGPHIWNRGKSVLNQHIYKLTIDPKIGSMYAFYCLKAITQEIERSVVGAVGLVHVTKKSLVEFKIPLPPLSEQQRIIAKLDTAFAEIDKAVEAADMSGKKLQEQQTLNTENVFNETCSPFKKIVLGDVCDGVQYGTSSKCSKIGKYPVLRMGNIQNGAFDVSDLVYLDDEIEAKKYELNKGDVLFNRTNSSVHVGKTGVFDEVDDYLFAGYLIRVNYLKDKVLPKFLSYYLNSRKIREYGFSVMSESINQSNINGTKLKKYPFYEVPLEAQKNAAQKISAVNRASDEAINLYRKKVKALIKLKSALLATELQSEAG